MTGTGVPKDERKGLKWIHKATFVVMGTGTWGMRDKFIYHVMIRGINRQDIFEAMSTGSGSTDPPQYGRRVPR